MCTFREETLTSPVGPKLYTIIKYNSAFLTNSLKWTVAFGLFPKTVTEDSFSVWTLYSPE